MHSEPAIGSTSFGWLVTFNKMYTMKLRVDEWESWWIYQKSDVKYEKYRCRS